MTRWSEIPRPQLPGRGLPIRLHDSVTGTRVPAAEGPVARLYVCGITPYDATHMGHATTYVTFDLLHRAWLDSGHEVNYVQNVTDIDDPLLERAERDGVAWQDLAEQQIELFAQEMAALSVLPPQAYVGAVEAMPLVVDAIEKLVASGHAYRLDVPDEHGDGAGDVYFAVHDDPHFGEIAGLSDEQMLEQFAERGGDPQRAGKHHPLDCLLWRTERPGEPSWDGGPLGHGRPGWHIECTAIALHHIGMGFDVQGGGRDLLFPHHEMGAAEGHLLTGRWPYARCYSHVGMVGLDGHKMSKSRGNLEFVSRLRRTGVEAPAIRLALLANHYRQDWEWTEKGLLEAQDRLARWRSAMTRPSGPDGAALVARLRQHLADDLDAPSALAALDEWAATDGDDAGSPRLAVLAADSLLGIKV